MKALCTMLISLVMIACNNGHELSKEGKLLFNSPTYSNSENDYYQFGEFAVENNMHNADTLPQNSYSQSIYLYQDDTTLLFGWEWNFQSHPVSIYAYPEVIYGWKPWYDSSTTTALPVRLEDISRLKVTYNCEMKIFTGAYNLTFDNWIGETSVSSPENIRFELMIWEDNQVLAPFGDYQETVVTTNGTYLFYMGEPDWEPEGSNWTYLAFVRTEKRTKGTVDIDEIIDYLIDKGITASDNYLFSIEFGNEIGNSKGYTIVKQFDIELL